MDSTSWAGTDSALSRFVAAETESALNAYRAKPDLVREHANIEAAISQGGYGRKQLNELIQNAADAITTPGGRIRVVLTKDSLYCANEGDPFTEAGFRTLMLSHSSEKRDDQIGRFGLGFKSVIQVTDSPKILSRDGSIAWSQRHSTEILSGLCPELDSYPILRLATTLDPSTEAAQDSTLSDLMDWATTVVKLPLRGNVGWLSDELKNFPHEFLLFSPNIGSLEFEDKVRGESLAWTSARDGDRVTLSNANTSEDWLLFRYLHQVSHAAAVEAGSIAAREQVEVSWAVPLTQNQRRKLGRFWNYFPTGHETSLRGIVNAAFKMNEDRHSILETRYNEEILTKALPIMVAGALPQLSTATDPAAFIDILPSRPREKESWADGVINKPIFQMLPLVPCLPDRSGKLRVPADIKIQPEFKEATKLTALWDTAVGDHRPWLHSAALTRDREAQVARILTVANLKRASLEEWLQEVVTGGEYQDFENALQLATMIDKSYDEYRLPMRRSRIVLMADGSIEAPIASRIFLPLDAEDESDHVVSYDLMRHGDAHAHLRALDLQAQDGPGRIIRISTQVGAEPENRELAESLWRLTRSFPIPEALNILDTRTEPLKILVRCRDHQWRPLGNVWLQGGLIPIHHPGDAGLLIDEQFHKHDVALLKNLGARSGLPEAKMVRGGGTYNAWKRAESARIVDELSEAPRPISEAGLKFPQALTTDGLDLLSTASVDTRAKVTRLLLSRKQYPTSVEFSSTYRPALKLEGPDLWWVRNFGALQTPLGNVNVNYCVGDIPGIPSGFLPFPGVEEAAALGLVSTATTVKWAYVLELAEGKLPIEKIHELYGALALAGVKAPKVIVVESASGGRRELPPSDVLVCPDEDTWAYLGQVLELPVLHSQHPEIIEALTNYWSMQYRAVEFTRTIVPTPSEADAPVEIRALFPFLKRAASGVKATTLCVPCSRIEEVVTNTHDDGKSTSPLGPRIVEGVFYYHEAQKGSALLAQILAAFGSTKKPADVVATMRQLKKDHEAEVRRQRVKGHKTDAGKVAELVGRETLRRLIPEAVFSMLALRDIELTDERLFEIVSNLHGASLLKVLKPALEEAGVETPDHFRGGRTAQEFVRELGFSPAMAGETIKRKPAREEFVGPISLSPLHGYQESTTRKIREMLSRRTQSTRGLVQLPTGAGKTRVAVESVINEISSTEGNQLVIWVAQSEELCEQAVDTWTYVWQAAGPSGKHMAVSRLWGGNNAVPEETKLHLVVATIQTLSSILQNRRQTYNWMADPDLVIIDEAHGAIASSYTPVLSWFGRSFSEKSRLLLGLSATPYRGSNEQETQRLVARFGGNLIEPDEFGAADAHSYLQDMGVLAHVRHEELDGIRLELKDMRTASAGDAQNAMLDARIDLQQVAGSTQRNEAILEHIEANTSGPTLVFAASVEHAEALAAVLTVEGIPAAAISGKTDLGHRRAVIEDFRNGKIRVLLNFDVLTQGFDAPKVEAVYVCRPTFSPNKYIQMIGRGLRGPLNGGSQEVLIVNIKDNLEQYGDELAFTKFDHLWHREAVDAT